VNILVIDVGGTHVKLGRTGVKERRRFDSSDHLTPEQLVRQTRAITSDWEYDAVALGIPGRVGPDGPISEPGNLGKGWVGFDYKRAFGKPVRVVNDAAMQALGAYDGGRMLFLGLGTGLGSALIVERVVIPLELGQLHNIGGEDRELMGVRLGKEGFESMGEAAWKKMAADAVCMLKDAFSADYVVIGGGHATLIAPLPAGVRRGGNDDAFTGGFRLWEENIEPHDKPLTGRFQVLR
jgi:polyphosphate glucokinase